MYRAQPECLTPLGASERLEWRAVVATFDGGAITSDAGGLLLAATDRVIDLMGRLSVCFHDVRKQELIEDEVVTLISQRVFGIALGYEDLNDMIDCAKVRSWRYWEASSRPGGRTVNR